MTTDQYALRTKVLFGVSSAFSVIVLPLIYLNIAINQFYTLAAAEVIFLFASLHIAMVAQKGLYPIRRTHSYLLSLLAIIAFALIQAPLLKGVFFWVLSIPIIFYILLGKKAGFIYTLVSLLCSYSIFFYKTSAEEAFFLLHQSGSANFITCYLTIWVVSHFYESYRERKEAELYRLANTDMLTGAYNRLAFKNTCDELVSKQQSFSIILIDIDHFKSVNDTYGHDCGDEVLIRTVELIQQTIGHTHIYRLGGEEFCILCPVTNTIDQCAQSAEDIRQQVEATPIKCHQYTVHITVSIGLAHYSDGQNLEQIFKQADNSMYQAKSNGRNQVVSAMSAVSE